MYLSFSNRSCRSSASSSSVHCRGVTPTPWVLSSSITCGGGAGGGGCSDAVTTRFVPSVVVEVSVEALGMSRSVDVGNETVGCDGVIIDF